MASLAALARGVMRSPWGHAPLGAVLLSIPALLNGFPFWWYDTAGYHLLGESIVRNLIEIASPHDAAPGALVVESDATGPVNVAPAGENPSLSYMGGRAPPYGIATYLANALGSYWWVAIAQISCAAWLVSASLRSVGLPGPRPFLLAIALVLFSSLPYFAATVMPDVFTGFAFVAALLLFARVECLGMAERTLLALLLVASVWAHQTNVPLTGLLLVAAASTARIMGEQWTTLARRVLWAGLPIMAAVVLNFSYLLVVRVALGEAPGNPPYLMARVLADGPGRMYLRDVCTPEPQFEICRFSGRPLDDPNDFLWSDDPAVGVFMQSEPSTRDVLIAEERRFVWGAVSRYPVEQFLASAGNALSLFGQVGVGPELRLSAPAWEGIEPLAPRQASRARDSLAYRGLFPLGIVDALNSLVLAASVIFVCWRLTRADVRAAYAHRASDASADAAMRRALTFIAIAVALWLVVNAVMCGALSGPFPRYQARTIWLVPLLAALVSLRLGFGAGHRGQRR